MHPVQNGAPAALRFFHIPKIFSPRQLVKMTNFRTAIPFRIRYFLRDFLVYPVQKSALFFVTVVFLPHFILC